MDKTAIKKYAVWARRELIRRVSQKAYEYGITENEIADEDNVRINSKLLSDVERKQRNKLIEEIKHKSFNQVMEEVAYTWFNRFCALRFMEVNNYLPGYVKVFTDEENNFNPLILKEATHLDLDGLNKEIVYEYLDDNKQDELYKYLIITQCNTLSKILPGMFQKIADYTELLFPDNLLREESVIGQMISSIPEEDWKDAVQIIGWLYQYYNTELNEQVYDGKMSKNKINKELLPAATTIYTPDWAVQYLVQNSLGKLWIDSHHEKELKNTWKYYLDEPEQDATVQAQLDAARVKYRGLKPQDLKIIDPCMGSGHILAYTFDILMQIYESCGYSKRDAVQNILKHNLYGLDIDDRAAQLAYFSVMMKARQYDPRALNLNIQPHIYPILESNGIDEDVIKYFTGDDATLSSDFGILVEELYDAKGYGSILNISNVNFDALYKRINEIHNDTSLFRGYILKTILPLIQVADVMAQKYDVVVTNPPYLGSSRFSPELDNYVKRNYADVKSDLSMIMYKHAIETMAKQFGYVAFITTSSWMFLSSFEKLRVFLQNNITITSLVDFGTELFDGKVGHNPIVAWVTNILHTDYTMIAIRLVDYCYSRRDEKEFEFFEPQNRYIVKQSNLSKIPGTPVAYWVGEKIVESFNNKRIQHYSHKVCKGVFTADNDKYLRFWYEVSSQSVMEGVWHKYSKGGSFRKWYGNSDRVIYWENNGFILKNDKKSGMGASQYFGKDRICWSGITTYKASFRADDSNVYFDDVSPSIIFDDGNNTYKYYLLALCNSKVVEAILNILNPTMHYQAGDVKQIPVILDKARKIYVDHLVEENIVLSRADWDSFETSWDFVKHPLIRNISTVQETFAQWEQECENRFNQLKTNEEELNRIFIDIYSLQDELTPEVEDKDVTVRKADLTRDIKSLISYSVGCMFGRYSLDVEGLAYAGGEWDTSKYSSFIPDKNNIIPILDDEYFQDDIVAYFVRFIETVYGESTLEENLRFIADALGGKGSSREVIRNYFMKDFYKDHCRIYQKRPIYWLFDSGKKDGFKALIYLHRYKPDIIARMRTEYVHEQQAKYQAAITSLENNLVDATPAERAKITKRLQKVKDQDAELLEFEEKIHHLADQMIKIDLDDGVKNNYELFKEVLANIK